MIITLKITTFKTRLFLIIASCFYFMQSFGQFALKDAILLNRLKQSYLGQGPNQEIESILLKYYDVNDINQAFDESSEFYNPFLIDFKEFISMGAIRLLADPLPPASVSFKKADNSNFSTNVILGLTDFIINRANQEIVNSFLLNFKKKFNEPVYQESLSAILPLTYQFITHDFSPIYLQRDLNKLKEYIQLDLKNFDQNYSKIFDIPFVHEIISKNEGLELIKNIAVELPNLIQKDFESKISNFLVENIVDIKPDNNSNFISTFKLFAYTFLSLVDENTMRVVSNLSPLSDPEIQKVYLGLLYAEVNQLKFYSESNKMDSLSKTIASRAYSKSSKTKLFFNSAFNYKTIDLTPNQPVLKSRKIDIAQSQDKLKNFAITVSGLISTIRSFNSINDLIADPDTNLSNLKAQISLLNSVFIFSDNLLDLTGLSTNKRVMERTEQVRTLLYNGLMIAVNFKDKNYDQALFSFSTMLSAMGLRFLPTENLLKYTTFITKLAATESPEQVSSLLESYALPIGSSSIKKNSNFSMSIQSYFSTMLGWESINDKRSSSLAGIDIPLGIDFSYANNNKSSRTFLVNLFNLGSVADYRLKADNIDPPKFTYKGILAPGLIFMHGRRNSPVSYGGGFEYRPFLREIDGQNQQSFQFKVKLAIDIPLFLITRK